MKLRFWADLRTLAFVGIYFALVIGQWWLVPGVPFASASDWLLAAGLFATTCCFSFFGAVITHNTIHSPVFVSRRVNRFFQVVLSLTYGSAVSAFVPGHNLSHHKHTQTPRDVMRTTKVRHRWNILNLIEFAPRVAVSITRNDVRYVRAMKGKHRAWFRQYMIESWSVLLVTAALFIVDWKKALVYWLVPHLYAAWGIISINYLQHDGCDEAHAYNHSRNFVGKMVNWVTFNNGFHGIHHDQPGLHWSLTPAAHARLVAPHIDPRLEQKSLLLYIGRAFILPGIRRSFDGKPINLPPATADESWIPEPRDVGEDLGAVAAG